MTVEAAPDLDPAPTAEAAPSAALASAPVVAKAEPEIAEPTEPLEVEAAPDAEKPDDLDEVISKTLKGEQPRDEAGKWKAREAASAPVDPTSANDGGDRIAGWDDASKAAYQALPEPARKFVLERAQATEIDTINKVNDFYAPMRRDVQAAQPFMKELTAPEVSNYLQRVTHELAQSDPTITPAKIVANVLKFESVMRYGTMEQKHAAFAHMAKSYGVALDPMADNSNPAGSLDPHEQQLHDARQEIARLKYAEQQREAVHLSHLSTRVASDIEAFAKAKDAQGNSLYPFYEQVRGSMGDLIASGRAPTLADAYKIASEPLHAELQRQSAQAAAKMRTEALAAAKRVAATKPVRGSMGQRTGRELSLDEMITANQAAH